MKFKDNQQRKFREYFSVSERGNIVRRSEQTFLEMSGRDRLQRVKYETQVHKNTTKVIRYMQKEL